MEFTLDDLEQVLLKEAQTRGDRLYRVIHRSREEVLFAKERLAVDVARIEKAFNLIRVSPTETSGGEYPERVVFHLSSPLSFEKAAEAVSLSMSGSVDIVQLPYGGWKEEKARWLNEGRMRAGSFASADRRSEIAKLLLSYKVLRFDMEAMARAVAPQARVVAPQARDVASESGEGAGLEQRMEDFEKRLSGLEAARLLFLRFRAGKERYLIPRFLVSAFRWNEAGGEARISFGSGKRGEAAVAAPGRDAKTAAEGGPRRFGVLESSGGFGELGADRLVSYREIGLGDIRLLARRSRICFEAEAEGEAWLILLPEGGDGAACA